MLRTPPPLQLEPKAFPTALVDQKSLLGAGKIWPASDKVCRTWANFGAQKPKFAGLGRNVVPSNRISPDPGEIWSVPILEIAKTADFSHHLFCNGRNLVDHNRISPNMGGNWSTMTGFRPTWAKFVSTIPDFAQHGRNLSPPCPDCARCVQICPRCDGISPSMGGRISAERLAPSTTGGQGRRSRREQHLTTDTRTRLATLPPPCCHPPAHPLALPQPFPNHSIGPQTHPRGHQPFHRPQTRVRDTGMRFLMGWRRLRPPGELHFCYKRCPMSFIYGVWRGRALPTADARAGVGGPGTPCKIQHPVKHASGSHLNV